MAAAGTLVASGSRDGSGCTGTAQSQFSSMPKSPPWPLMTLNQPCSPQYVPQLRQSTQMLTQFLDSTATITLAKVGGSWAQTQHTYMVAVNRTGGGGGGGGEGTCTPLKLSFSNAVSRSTSILTCISPALPADQEDAENACCIQLSEQPCKSKMLTVFGIVCAAGLTAGHISEASTDLCDKSVLITLQTTNHTVSSPVPDQPVGHAIVCAVSLNSNSMHFSGTVAVVLEDAASITLQLRSDADAAHYGASGGYFSHHGLLPCHLTCSNGRQL